MKTRRLLSILALVALVSMLFVRVAYAAGPGEQCHDLFMTLRMYKGEILAQKKAHTDLLHLNLPFQPILGFATYRRLAKIDPDLASLFPEREVLRIFATEEMPYFERSLESLMLKLDERSRQTSGLPSDLLAEVLRKELFNKVPRAQIDLRIALFKAGKIPIERILGDNTLAETQILYHGGNPLAPTSESLMGQYLAESGAASVVRSFNQIVINPATAEAFAQGGAPQGEKRLAVAVSKDSFAVWRKYFARVDMLSVFAHAQVVQNGSIVSTSQVYQDLRALNPGHILPALILKTTEAQRAEFYLNLIANRGPLHSWNQEIMVPWEIKDYCSTMGAYETCTHWIGNMPIGDRRVEHYVFPGAVDEHAHHPIAPGVTEERKAEPRIAKLTPHQGAVDPRVNKIFQAPGYEQLTGVIGQTASNGDGNWVNPGWLITSLIAGTSASHVPFVFVFQDDVAAPLDPKFVPVYETPW